MSDPTLATKTIKREYSKCYLTFRVVGGLHYIKGNRSPYFSITVDEHRKGHPNQMQAGGCNHEDIKKYFPNKFDDLIALHLCDQDGAPTHALENGYYWLAGAVGGLAQEYHGGSGHDKRTRDDCLRILAEHYRISKIDALQLCAHIQGIFEDTRAGSALPESLKAATLAAKAELGVFCDSQRLRWKHEADECIKRHNLVVFGDRYDPQSA